MILQVTFYYSVCRMWLDAILDAVKNAACYSNDMYMKSLAVVKVNR